MYNTTRFIAKTQKFDVEAFNTFALQHKDKYGVFEDSGLYWVSNWHSDALIEDFQAAMKSAGAQDE